MVHGHLHAGVHLAVVWRCGGLGRGWMVMLAEGLLQPFLFPLRFVIIVGRHRAVGLHVGNDMLAGIGKEIATRPPNSLDIAFLFAGGAKVDVVFGKNDEHSPFQNCHGISGCDIANCWPNKFHEGCMGNAQAIGHTGILWLIFGFVLVVQNYAKLVLHELGSCPSFFQDGFLITHIAKCLFLLDEFSANFTIIIQGWHRFVKVNSTEKVKV